MSIRTICDGCERTLRDVEIEVTAERQPMVGGGGIPSGRFHLCRDCARTAFAAIALVRTKKSSVSS